MHTHICIWEHSLDWKLRNRVLVLTLHSIGWHLAHRDKHTEPQFTLGGLDHWFWCLGQRKGQRKASIPSTLENLKFLFLSPMSIFILVFCCFLFLLEVAVPLPWRFLSSSLFVTLKLWICPWNMQRGFCVLTTRGYYRTSKSLECTAFLGLLHWERY